MPYMLGFCTPPASKKPSQTTAPLFRPHACGFVPKRAQAALVATVRAVLVEVVCKVGVPQLVESHFGQVHVLPISPLSRDFQMRCWLVVASRGVTHTTADSPVSSDTHRKACEGCSPATKLRGVSRGRRFVNLMPPTP